MKKLPLALVSVCLLLTCGVANAASYDCSKASTPRERLICATPQLSADDMQLGTTYATALGLLPSAGAQALRLDERRWLKALDRWCPLDQRSGATVKCLDQAYQQRITMLPNIVMADALITMPSDPTAAERVFRHYDGAFASLGLAMDLRLFLPDEAAHQGQITSLLKRSLPPDFVLDIPDARPAYDGSVASLVPYMIAYSLSQDDPNLPGGPGLPVSCDIIVQYPVLLDSTEPRFGSSSDNFVPQVDCDNSRFTPDNTVTGYADMLRSFSNLDRECGGTEEYSQISRIAYENWIVNLLPAALLGTTRYDGTNGTYLRQKNGDLEKLIEAAPKDQHSVPLARWTYSGPNAYLQAAPLVHAFPAARAALAQRYETVFGFSPKDASSAAQIGVWVLDKADSWALDSGAPDPLAKAILTGAPVSAVKTILPATGTNSTLPPVYLADAVLNTAVIPLLLQARADVNGVDDDGVTALMEAAMHDKPDAVKLLLAAGGSVNTVTAAADNCADMGNAMGDAPRPGLYPPPPARETALMFAASNASLPVIQQLVTAGADKGAKDANAQTALNFLNNRLQFQAFLAEQRRQRSGPITLSPTDAAAARHLLTP